jgi:hypothetical protein
MRILLSLLLAFSMIQLAKAQNRLELNDNSISTEQEGQFLDSLLRGQRGRFEFPTKRVAFLYGGSTASALFGLVHKFRGQSGRYRRRFVPKGGQVNRHKQQDRLPVDQLSPRHTAGRPTAYLAL